MKRQIIPKSFEGCSSNFESFTGVRTFCIFQALFSKIGQKHPYVNQLPWKPDKT